MNRNVYCFKLVSDPLELGLSCRRDGVTFGGYPLFQTGSAGLSPRASVEIQSLLDAAYGFDTPIRADDLMPRLTSVARALEKGDLPLAMIGCVLLKLPDIPGSSPLAKGAIERAVRERAAKASFDPAQPRAADGRWTAGSGGAPAPSSTQAQRRPTLDGLPVSPHSATPPAKPTPVGPSSRGFVATGPESPPGVGPDTATSDRTFTSRPGNPAFLAPPAGAIAGDIAGEGLVGALGGEAGASTLAELAPLLGVGGGAVLATLIPTNRSNIVEGKVPDAPGLTYRSDEGVVDIHTLDSNGNPVLVYHGVPDKDGFYYDDEGLIIGRHDGREVLFDTDALMEMAAEKTGLPGGSEPPGDQPPNWLGSKEDRPRFCPPPSPESIKGRSIWSLLYQSQITGLPPGFDVRFNGVRYDGCDEALQHLKEAKARMPRFLTMFSDQRLRQTRFYNRIMRQATRQSYAAVDHYDDWYFADERLAEFFTREFRTFHLDNLIVHHVDATFFRRMEECALWGLGKSISVDFRDTLF